MPLQAVPFWCVGCVGPNSKRGIGEGPVRDALVASGAIAAEACVWVKNGRIDVIARILGFVPPAAKVMSVKTRELR